MIVLLEVTIKKVKQEDYLAMTTSLKESLQNADVFLGLERFSSLSVNGKLLSKSEWKDEENVAQWRNLLAHRLCQKYARENDFVDYKITVVTPIPMNTSEDKDKCIISANMVLRSEVSRLRATVKT